MKYRGCCVHSKDLHGRTGCRACMCSTTIPAFWGRAAAELGALDAFARRNRAQTGPK